MFTPTCGASRCRGPWIERRLSGDTAHHNLVQRPRDVPVRTGIGMMALALYGAAGHAVPGSLLRPDPPEETAALEAAARRGDVRHGLGGEPQDGKARP
ncbi:hypothetical protein ACWED2_29460 [Amycolatopsis sp. NPDC005003]